MEIVATKDQLYKEIHRLTKDDHRFRFSEDEARQAADYLIENWRLTFTPPHINIPIDYPSHNHIMVSICKKAGGFVPEDQDNTVTHFLMLALPAE